MENIILFRFHGNFEVCRERIKILQYLNPGIPIYGLYGGDKQSFDEAKAMLSGYLVNLKASSSRDGDYKWFHPDQTLKEWYLDYGRTLDFKFLYDYEFDILTLESLDKLYPQIREDSIALSGVERLDEVKNHWSWTSNPPFKGAFEKLCTYMGQVYGIKAPTWVSLGPGPYFSKRFLDDFSGSRQPEDLIRMVISEIMYPYYAEALGYEIVNTELIPGREDKVLREKYFNCNDIEIKKEVVVDEAKKSDGVRAFHPVKYNVTLEEIKTWSLLLKVPSRP